MTPDRQDAPSDTPDLSALEPLAQFFLDGGTIGEALGYTAREYEAMYAVGHGLYTQAHYEDAARLFRLLVLYEPAQARFQTALGASLQMQGHYQDAINHHAIAGSLDLDDPEPALRISECLMAQGRMKEAVQGLDLVLMQCEPGGHDDTAQRARAMKELIEQGSQAAKGASS